MSHTIISSLWTLYLQWKWLNFGNFQELLENVSKAVLCTIHYSLLCVFIVPKAVMSLMGGDIRKSLFWSKKLLANDNIWWKSVPSCMFGIDILCEIGEMLERLVVQLRRFRERKPNQNEFVRYHFNDFKILLYIYEYLAVKFKLL